MALLKSRDALAARALELKILTATRTKEILGAQWSELDFSGKVWVIPAERMKMGRLHRVPLSGLAMEIFQGLFDQKLSNKWVFPGRTIDMPLCTNSMLALLKRLERNDITPHGFRSTFRDWSSECTAYPHEVCEAALAHVVKNKSEAAYRRGDLFEKRTRLMQDWADYCACPLAAGANVVAIRAGA